MSKGIIYFIQPCSHVGTDRFKIGCSKNPDLDRFNKYHKGTRFIFIMECNNPLVLGKKIKNEFNESPDINLIAGGKYYQGDENIMKKTFLHLCTFKTPTF